MANLGPIGIGQPPAIPLASWDPLAPPPAPIILHVLNGKVRLVLGILGTSRSAASVNGLLEKVEDRQHCHQLFRRLRRRIGESRNQRNDVSNLRHGAAEPAPAAAALARGVVHLALLSPAPGLHLSPWGGVVLVRGQEHLQRELLVPPVHPKTALTAPPRCIVLWLWWLLWLWLLLVVVGCGWLWLVVVG